ncbi:NAD(P)-dependent oxidoreductase [Niabella terrae]
MRVLVTGATGFIGRYVIAALLRHPGVEVIATSLHPEKAACQPWKDQVLYKAFDIKGVEESPALFEYFERPDILIHLAWEGLPQYRLAHHLEVNLPLHRTFIRQLVTGGLKNVNITGTCFEYGMQEGRLSEDLPAQPDNPYAKAKNELRLYVEGLCGEKGLACKWLRLFYMFGPGQAAGSLISQLETALDSGDAVFNMSGGEQVRDFLPVEQVAAYIVAASLQTQVQGIINICSNHPVTVRQLVEDYLRQTGRTIRLNLGYYPYPDFEPMRFWGDNKKLKSIYKEYE